MHAEVLQKIGTNESGNRQENLYVSVFQSVWDRLKMKDKKSAILQFYIPTELECLFILLIKISPKPDLSEATGTVIDIHKKN